jgi:hypothetical protein
LEEREDFFYFINMPSEIGKNVLPGDPYNLPDFARNFFEQPDNKAEVL